MKRIGLILLLCLLAPAAAQANWRLYREDAATIASVDYATFASFRHKPSVWVRWKYRTPKNGVAGMKIQFSADCKKGRLLAIYQLPYGPAGNYIESRKQKLYDAPIEYPVTPNSLNEATYRLLCH